MQEAEEISKQKLLLTHTNRDIPDAANPIWKLSEDSMESTGGVKLVEISHEASNVSDNISISTEKPAYIGHKIPEEFLKKAGLHKNDSDDRNNIRPLYSLKSDGGVSGMYFSSLILLLLLFQAFGLLKLISYSRYASRSFRSIGNVWP